MTAQHDPDLAAATAAIPPTDQVTKFAPNQRRAIKFALLAVLLWSTVATAFKLALVYLTPIQLLTIAALISVATFAVIMTWQRRWREAMQIGGKRYKFYIFQGFINPFAYYLVLFSAYNALPAQQAQAINYSWAITMALLAVPILKQKLSRRALLAMLVAYVGVIFIATGGRWDFQQTNWIGIGLALGSTLLWAGYWLSNIHNQDKPIPALFWCFVFGSLWLLLAQWAFVEEPWQGYQQLPLQGWIGGIYVGLFEMGITFLVWLTAMRSAVNAGRISSLIFLSPFISLLFIYFILGETIHYTTIIGLLLIIIGLSLQGERT